MTVQNLPAVRVAARPPMTREAEAAPPVQQTNATTGPSLAALLAALLLISNVAWLLVFYATH
jgi:hypothetical protein